MLTKVIYADGSSGIVRTCRLAKLIKMNQIASYASFNSWVELRRKKLSEFNGMDRRKAKPEGFYEGFQF